MPSPLPFLNYLKQIYKASTKSITFPKHNRWLPSANTSQNQTPPHSNTTTKALYFTIYAFMYVCCRFVTIPPDGSTITIYVCICVVCIFVCGMCRRRLVCHTTHTRHTPFSKDIHSVVATFRPSSSCAVSDDDSDTTEKATEQCGHYVVCVVLSECARVWVGGWLDFNCHDLFA